MSDDPTQSVTMWIQNLKEGKDDSARELWDRYFDRLVGLARRKLGNAEKRVSDEEDIAVNVFHALCEGAAAGRFEQLENREDLWMLLVAITGNKAVDQVRKQTSQKRGAGEVRGNSIFNHDTSDSPMSFETVIGDEPSPEFLFSMEEEYGRLFEMLRDDTHREIVRHKLAGHSNPEVAKLVGISLRSVERKLEVIRGAWSQEFEDERTTS